MNNRREEHFLKTLLYDKISSLFKIDPSTLIQKDMDKLEKHCNEVLDNGEVDVVYYNSMQGIIVNKLKILYDVTEIGFVIPNSCKFILN